MDILIGVQSFLTPESLSFCPPHPQYFIYDNFKHAEKLKGLFGEHACTYPQ